jgi:hypothetical protein
LRRHSAPRNDSLGVVIAGVAKQSSILCDADRA